MAVIFFQHLYWRNSGSVQDSDVMFGSTVGYSGTDDLTVKIFVSENRRWRAVAKWPSWLSYWCGALFLNKKLSYPRETARQLHTSFSAHSLVCCHSNDHTVARAYPLLENK